MLRRNHRLCWLCSSGRLRRRSSDSSIKHRLGLLNVAHIHSSRRSLVNGGCRRVRRRYAAARNNISGRFLLLHLQVFERRYEGIGLCRRFSSAIKASVCCWRRGDKGRGDGSGVCGLHAWRRVKNWCSDGSVPPLPTCPLPAMRPLRLCYYLNLLWRWLRCLRLSLHSRRSLGHFAARLNLGHDGRLRFFFHRLLHHRHGRGRGRGGWSRIVNFLRLFRRWRFQSWRLRSQLLRWQILHLLQQPTRPEAVRAAGQREKGGEVLAWRALRQMEAHMTQRHEEVDEHRTLVGGRQQRAVGVRVRQANGDRLHPFGEHTPP